MIGIGKTISYTFNSLNYAQTKENAKEVDRYLLSGETPRELSNEFQIFQSLNNRAEKNTFSFVLSPVDKDSHSMKKGEWKEITRDFLKKLDLNEHQYIAYKHNDNGHNHLHIYVNRINEKGKAADDTFISNKASRAAEQIAKERNMKLAGDIWKEKQKRQHNQYKKVYEAHKEVIKDADALSGYTNRMERKGYRPHFKQSKTGKIVGVQFPVNGKMVKGSAIHRSMSGGNIEKAIYLNRDKKQQSTMVNNTTQNTYQEKNTQTPFIPNLMPGFNVSLDQSKAADGDEEEKKKKKKKHNNRGLEL